MNAHLIAAMNVATLALLRIGYERMMLNLLFALLFLAALFVAFTSAPMTAMTYVPVYAALWAAFLIPNGPGRAAVLWRLGAIAFALLVLGLIGVPSYLSATAAVSARGGTMLPVFHQGWQLLSFAFWWEATSSFAKWWLASSPLCQPWWQLMCPTSFVGWFEITALVGSMFLAVSGNSAKRRYGLVIAILIIGLHVYALLNTRSVLGRLHLISTPFLMWALFPLAPPAAVAAGIMVADWITRRRSGARLWLPAVASCLIAAFAIFVWRSWIGPYQPRLSGEGPLGFPPISLIPAHKGPIAFYLQKHIGLKPGAPFRGYAATVFDAPDGLMRKASSSDRSDINSAMTYLTARQTLRESFGSTFQEMDLWNNGIPTFEEYGQWVSQQIFSFHRDLLAAPQDKIDARGSILHVYRFRPLLLRALGVRFVIADGTLTDPLIELVMTETGKAGAAINLYEIKGANVGQFSPTQVTWVGDYPAAVSAVAGETDFERRAILLGPPRPLPGLVPGLRCKTRGDQRWLSAKRDSGGNGDATAPGAILALLACRRFRHIGRTAASARQYLADWRPFQRQP